MKLDKSFVFKRFKNELEAKYGAKKAAAIWRYAGRVLQKLEAAPSGGDNVNAVVGDPACAVSVECEGGMTISPALASAA